MHQLILSKEQLRKIKRIMEFKGIHFPISNKLNEAHKKLRSAVSSVLDGRGVYADYYNLITGTATLLLTSHDDQGIPIDLNFTMKLYLKDGYDSAGQQATWKSVSIKKAAPNMFQYGIIALHLTSISEVIWKNPSPNSADSLRPIFLIREKENNEELLNLMMPATDNA